MHLASRRIAADHDGMRTFLLCCVCIALLPGLDLDRLSAPTAGSALLDPVGRLDAAARSRCEAAARSAAPGRLVILVVPDCGGRNPREAGLRLFNRWGIGDRQRNDGVLLLVALAERRAEFLLGTGLDDDGNVLRSQAIVDRRMLPLFRAGDVAGAVVAGSEAAARELFGGATATAVTTAEVDVETAAPAARTAAPMPVRATPVQTETPSAVHRHRPQPDGDVNMLRWILGGGLTAIAGGTGALVWLRRRPRTCPHCRLPMIRLDEAADDAHLSSGQRSEEAVGSVDYDVWACPSCPRVQVTRHGAWFTSHHRCPACGWKTASDRSTEIEAATTLSSGRERIDTRCAHCGHHETSYRTLPRIQQRRSSGFRSSGFGSSGGSGSRSGGGGRSSGRGGGGGW